MKWNDLFFQWVHRRKLIYNTCWEDPQCDRQLMAFTPESKILMITSAGCNALTYLLDDPIKIDCVDLNYRQNALLALKIAFFRYGDYDLLFQFLGKGYHPKAKEIYQQRVRPNLDPQFHTYWDRKISYFNGKGLRKSFYYRGASGMLAWLFRQYVRLRPRTYQAIHALMHPSKNVEQSDSYLRAKQSMFTPMLQWVIQQPFVLGLAGVPGAQKQLFASQYSDIEGGYLGYSFDKVFLQLPITENYFYSLYWNGEYDPYRCPAYLKQENFEWIRDRVDRISWHTASISSHLAQSNTSYSHFILLDHQDWLVDHMPDELHREWYHIFQSADAFAKVLFRSASDHIDWLPHQIATCISFDKERAAEVHKQDRVGMYASTWMGTISR